MNVIDVYDIANSTWYKQSTSGKTPEYRVNPCAVVAAAAEYVSILFCVPSSFSYSITSNRFLALLKYLVSY